MKRNSQLTIRLQKSLVKQGRAVTTRKLERWSIDELGPLDESDFSGLVAHYAQVADLSSIGRDKDTVARRLAARGFACKRLRPAILRELGITPETPLLVPALPDLSSGPSGDAAFAAIEHFAEVMATDTRGLPALLVKVVKALQRNASERASQVGESPEQILHSYFVNALVHLMGDNYYNGRAMEAVLGLDDGAVSVEVLDLLNTGLRVSMPALDNTYRTAPVEQIAFMAQRMTAWAPLLLDHLEVIGVKTAEIEDLATVFAPAAVYFANLLREAFDDFPDDYVIEAPLPQIEVPPVLIKMNS
ncbi:MAG TPA: hypothetical protein VHB02_18395 [Acidimicrobiales bacterium]|nr:hypothetical protein [Acidimicrobiales bacterium]